MKIDVTEALAAFKILELVDSHSGILSSQFIKLHYEKNRLFLNLTGMALTAVSFPVTESSGAPWTFYLDRRIWGTFLQTTAAKIVELKMDNTLTLKAGRHKVTVPGMNAVAGYKTWVPSSEAKILKISPELCAELAILSEYAPITAAADHISAVYLLKGYGIIATDSFCVSIKLDKTVAHTFPIPVTFTKLITKEKKDAITLDKAGSGMKYPCGYVFEASTARSQTDYPVTDIQKVVTGALAAKPSVRIPAKKLLAGLEYLNKFIFGSPADVNVKLSGKANEKVVRLSMTSSNGEFHQLLDGAEILVPDFTLTWPISKVLPWVSYLAELDETIVCGVSEYHFFFPVSKNRILIIA